MKPRILVALACAVLIGCGGGGGGSETSSSAVPLPDGYVAPPGAVIPPGYEPPPDFVPAPDYVPPGGYVPPPSIIVPTNALLDAVNGARAASRMCGTVAYPAAPPVAWSGALEAAAMVHSLEMLTNNFLSVAPTGEAIFATNTVNFPFAEDVVEAMIGSPTNCRAVMDPTFRAVGAGSAEADGCKYWTFDFGS